MRRRAALTPLLAAALLLGGLSACGRPGASPPAELQPQGMPALLDPLSVPKYVNPLPNPLEEGFIFQPTSGNHYDIGIYQLEQNLLGPGFPDTTVWGYGTSQATATYPGRTFVAHKDQEISVRWANDLVDGDGTPLPHLLPIDTSLHWADPLEQGHDEEHEGYTGPVVTHLHGGHTESASDGLPDAWFTPGFEYTGDLFNEVYTYANDQEAATLWYHDHALGITRLNVYAGLAGFYILRDEHEEALVAAGQLPTGPYEIPLVIQDRLFTADAQLYYPAGEMERASVMPEFFGDVILVNGKAWPILEVEPRQYRLRLLNGSDSRFYTLFLSSRQAFYQIGGDSGLLDAPVALNQLTLAPGERADVVLDFSDPALWGQTILMRNNARSPFPKGATADPRTTGQIMALRVSKPLEPSYPLTALPASLRAEPIAPLVQDAATRKLLLFEGTDEEGRIHALLGTAEDGAKLWEDEITEEPHLNDVEVWEFYNTTPDAHPIHLHLVAFQVLGRQKFSATQDPETGALTGIRLQGQAKPPAANERGFKDTVIAYPGEVTRVIAKFDRAGEYVWHCHILSHEDHEMMRRYRVMSD